MRVLTPRILLLLVWPPPRSLATTSGISVDVFSSPYLDVSVQAVPHVYLLIQYTLHRYESVRVAPFGNPRIYRLFTAPRGLSQLATSFFGSQCQGIPLALFLAWPFLTSFDVYVILFVLNKKWIVVLILITLFLNVHDFSRRLSYTPISRLSFFCSVFKVRSLNFVKFRFQHLMF